MGEKQCSKCGDSKSVEEFSLYKKSKDGRSSWCKKCNAESTLRRYHSMTLEERKAHNRARAAKVDNSKRRAQYAASPEIRRKAIECQVRDRRRLRDRLYAGYGSKCSCCGEAQPLFLQLDHVNGGGVQHYRRTSPPTVYREVIAANFPPSYRLLCANCNMGRWRNGGICPHEAQRQGVLSV